MFLIRGRETQIWRYFTHLFYYGSLALGPIVKLVITVGIFRRVEEYCFRGRAADYLLFILFTGFFLT
jgi:Derlin-2/3